MRQVHKNMFSLRLHSVGGQFKAEQIAKISEIADKYGHGYIHLTSRQGIEIPFVGVQDVDKVREALATVGLRPGTCGPRVRTITACQGSAICPSALIETTELAKELDERYFGRELPHKFKIGVTGCKNNCLKAEENDLGIKGGQLPLWKQDSCTYCGLCQAVCPSGAIEVDRSGRTLSFNESLCIWCGKCVKSCPTNAWEGKSGYILSFGGTFGNNIRSGEQLVPIIFEKSQLFQAADTAIAFFEKHGRSSERFGAMLVRVGTDLFREELMEAIK